MSGTVQTRAFHSTQAIIYGRHLEVIPSKRASGTVQVRSGSRRSRDGRGSSGTRLGEGPDAFDVSEGMVGELGVSATRVFGDGRFTWKT